MFVCMFGNTRGLISVLVDFLCQLGRFEVGVYHASSFWLSFSGLGENGFVYEFYENEHWMWEVHFNFFKKSLRKSDARGGVQVIELASSRKESCNKSTAGSAICDAVTRL